MTRKATGLWRITATLCVVAALSNCAGPEPTRVAPPPEPALAQNVVPFDVGVCAIQMPALPEPPRADALNGWLLSADPLLRECWLNPAHRGTDAVARLDIQMSLDARGVRYEVASKALTPAGIACMKKALGTLQPPSRLPDSALPLVTKRALTFDAKREDVVTANLGAASDTAGALRLAMPRACACFSAWSKAIPAMLALTVVIDPARPTPALNFELTNNSASDALGECLQTELAKVAKAPAGTPSFRYVLPFIHSGVTEPLLSGPLRLRTQHLEAVRRRKLATTLVRWATRDSAAQAYERVVSSVRAGNPGAKRRKAEHQAVCRNLVIADDRLIDALGELVDTESELHALARENQNPEAIVAAAQRQTDTARELQQAQTARARDAVPCPH
ncbi:MAG: hypothetical protein ACKVPX_00700 [Myxococcaceae bacterium]